eukprot:gene9355-9518_t
MFSVEYTDSKVDFAADHVTSSSTSSRQRAHKALQNRPEHPAGASALPSFNSSSMAISHGKIINHSNTEASGVPSAFEEDQPLPASLGCPDSAGQLMSLIQAAQTLEDMEDLLRQHHSSFMQQHVAAAVLQLPRLSSGSGMNSHRRMRRLTVLLGGAVINVAHQLDPHQSAGCIAALSKSLALLSPFERIWPLLERVAVPQLPTFSAASLAQLAHSFAAASHASHHLMLSVCNAALAKTHKFDTPESILQLLQALAITNMSGQQQLLEALCRQMAANKAAFSSLQLVEAATALEQLPHYSEEACLAVCKAASRSTKRWPSGQLVRLLVCLAKLQYRDEPMLQAAVKQLTVAGVPQLSGAELADVLWVVLQLGYDAPALEQLVAAAVGHLPLVAEDLTPEAAVKLLWSLAVLEECDLQLQALLVQRLAGATPQQLSQDLLCLLHQAHRLLNTDWLLQSEPARPPQGSAASAELAQPAQDLPATQSIPGHVLHEASNARLSSSLSHAWPEQLLVAAAQAATVRANRSAGLSRQQQQHVQDLFEELGQEAPVTGLQLDYGALQPDLAFVAPASSRGASGSAATRGSDMKIAVMCDHAGRCSRNPPWQLLGYWTAHAWLLEQAGWKVVRLPAYEWQLLVQDPDAEDGSDLAWLCNSLAVQGIQL